MIDKTLKEKVLDVQLKHACSNECKKEISELFIEEDRFKSSFIFIEKDEDTEAESLCISNSIADISYYDPEELTKEDLTKIITSFMEEDSLTKSFIKQIVHLKNSDPSFFEKQIQASLFSNYAYISLSKNYAELTHGATTILEEKERIHGYSEEEPLDVFLKYIQNYVLRMTKRYPELFDLKLTDDEDVPDDLIISMLVTDLSKRLYIS